MSNLFDRLFRRQQRRSGCALPATTWTTPAAPVRPPEKCAPVPDPVVPEFVTPPEPTTPANLVLTLADIVMSNEETSVTCADVGGGPEGDAVVIAAGAVTRRLFWSDIPGLLQEQRNYMATLDPSVLVSMTAEGVSSSTVQSTLRLVPSQAAVFLQLASDLRAEIAEDVQTNARSKLRCVWFSEELTLACPAGCAETGETGYAIAAGVTNPVVIPAGQFTSDISQADANAQALAEATSRRVCLYGNELVTVDCVNTLGKPTAVPNDLPSDAVITGRPRRGEFTINAGTFYRATLAEANEAARLAGIEQLDCFYVNDQVTVVCDDATASQQPRSSDEGIPGNPITVPRGRTISENSQTEANTLAEDLAETLLECVFYNTDLTVTCPLPTVAGVQLSSEDATREVFVPAGSFSSTSVAAANELAITLTLLQMQCQYCNTYIPPACYPDTVTVAPGEALSPEDVDSTWATNVVLGLRAGTYCSTDPEQVGALAQAAAYQRPLMVEQGCIYENDEMWFGCLLDLPGAPTLPPGGYHHPDYAPEQIDHPSFPYVSFADKLSSKSTPSPSLGADSYIKIAARTIPINSLDVPDGVTPKEYANEQARLYGLALLNCTFVNPEHTWTCANAWDPARFADDARFGHATPGPNGTPIVSVTTPYARYSSNVSFSDAVEQARQAAIGTLDCYYTNNEVRVSCWEEHNEPSSLPSLADVGSAPDWVQVYGTGRVNFLQETNGDVYDNIKTLDDWQLGSLARPLIIAAGTVRSTVSKADANEQAMLLAKASLECAAAARDAALVCNDPLLIKCGGVVEPHPQQPYREGSNAPLLDKWNYVTETRTEGDVTRTEVTLVIGDGRNSMMGDPGTGWAPQDLGCSEDPVGGCAGTGLRIPPCVVTAATKLEANLMAYNLFRQQMSCQGPDTPPAGGGTQPDAFGCAFPFRIYSMGGDKYYVCGGYVRGNVAPLSEKVVMGRSFTGGVDRYVVLEVQVFMSMQDGWLTDFGISDAALKVYDAPPSAAAPLASGGVFSYLVGSVQSGVISQNINGDVVLCGMQAPLPGYIGKALMRPC